MKKVCPYSGKTSFKLLMNPREKLLALIFNEPLKKADSIVLLEGDIFNRITEAARLYKEGWSKKIVISGNIDNPPHSIPAKRMLPELIKLGVPKEDVELEEKSLTTRDQAVEVMQIVQKKGWKRVILVASNYHQLRAFMTFLKAMKEQGLQIEIINAPARDLKWFEETGWGTRIDLLETEIDKIEQYQKKGHVVSYEEALEYQQWKELQQ